MELKYHLNKEMGCEIKHKTQWSLSAQKIFSQVSIID